MSQLSTRESHQSVW